MNEKHLVICDEEFRYARNLGEMISESDVLAVKVYTCTSLEKTLELAKEKQIHILLISEKYCKEERDNIEAKQTFVLTKGTVENLNPKEHMIYKYQSADQIVQEILETYAENVEENIIKQARRNKTKLLAVYSPIHRVGKSRFAIALGKELSKKEKVLYINMEEYPGEPFLDVYKNHLGDVICYLKQKNFGLRLQTTVQRVDGLDYIPPMEMCTDLREIALDEWIELFEMIFEHSNYETLILDLGESVQGLFKILQKCNEIYMPTLEDEASRKKLQRYEETIRRLGMEKLFSCTRQFIAPTLGRYIQSILLIRI